MKSELLQQISLLYVEDDNTIRDLLSRSLSRTFHNLHVASNGQEGYEQYLKHKPDIIITDIKMPIMNGLEMCKLIRKIDENIPIIVTSAHSEAVNFLEAIEIGVTSYLLKPINKKQLKDMLESNAKIVLYEREKEDQQCILQEVINLQPSIVFSSNEKKVLFANQLFLDFFSSQLNLENLEDNSITIYESLKNNKNITLEINHEYDSWIDYILNHKNESFRLRIKKDDQLKFFYVKTKGIIKHCGEESIIVVLNETL